MKGLAFAVACTLAAAPPTSGVHGELQPAPTVAEGPSDPPGGYRRMGEWREPQPKDGHTEIIIGGVIAPLGAIRTGLGIGQVVAASGENCTNIVVEGFGASEQDCATIRTLGWVGVGYGALMLATGIVLLALGLKRRAEHREWKKAYGLSPRPGWDLARLPPPPNLAPGFNSY